MAGVAGVVAKCMYILSHLQLFSLSRVELFRCSGSANRMNICSVAFRTKVEQEKGRL